MKSLIALLLVASVSAYAAPGRPDECGLIANQAFTAQKARNINLEGFEDSNSFIKTKLKQFNEISEQKIAEGMDPARAAKIMSVITRHTKFAAKHIYIRSSSADPIQVRDYVNSMCLIDLDE